MSNKVDATEMKPKTKRGLTPKLRFPEFRDAPEWEENTLGEVISLEYGGSLPEQSRQSGTIPVIGSNGIVGYHNQYLVEGPVIVIGRKGSAGQVNWINSDCYPIDTTFYVKNKKANDYLLPFLMLILERNNLERLKDNGAVPGLNRNEVYLIKSSFPKPNEQRKIADCLSSLDELIAAQSHKLDTLKDHKKGLVQQLFPAEGETLPRLRFPEFQDGPEWEEKPLGKIAENLDNRRIPVTESNRVPGKIPYYGASGIVYYINDFIFDEDLLCVSEDGANLVARTSPIAFSISGKSWVNNHAHVLRFENSATQKIVESYLNSIRLDDFLSGMAQPKLNRSMLDSIPVPLPDVDEQQKIADCLSSLDELIAAQSQKLHALKTHKKGLMQQLFPTIDEVQE